MVVLEVNIKKKFKKFQLDTKFSVGSQTLGILGSSGCGKSMTLKCIAGIVTPDEGLIRLGDRTLFDSTKRINLPPQERHVGYLFQSYALFPNMTVFQNLMIGYKSEKSDSHNMLEKIMTRFSIKGLEDRFPSQLSGGQQQRVALARIFLSSPEVLLLDEPFSAIDSYLKEQLQIELFDLLSEYTGPKILVTHNRDEVFQLSQNLMIVDDGKVVTIGETKELFDNPRKIKAAQITGCKNISKVNKMNDTQLYSPKWNTEFTLNTSTATTISCVGIRAHSFFPVSTQEENTIKVHHKKTVETPFETILLFGCDGGTGEIWWKIPNKEIDVANIHYLKVKQDDLLLLEE